MFFGFGRRFFRRLLLCLFLFAFIIVLKQNNSSFRQNVSQWITGPKDHPVTKAVSSFIGSLTEGDTFKTAVEVFYENLDTCAQD